MDIMSRDSMINYLREGVCRVTFTKKNGEERVMLGTLNFEYVPEDKRPKSDGNVDDKPVNTNIVKVYDTEKEAWRSFRVDSVTEFFSTQEPVA